MTPSSPGGGRNGPTSHATLLALCARILALQRRTEELGVLEQRVEQEKGLLAASRYHGQQVRLVQRRLRLIDRVCRLPATTFAMRRAKAEALLTLVILDPEGRPEHPEDWPLWSALQDLAADWSGMNGSSAPTPPE
ncbi:hypothetical protein [Roseomonas chloroacetimidivorans]|uniref:hypothetical protein n=1 Tax=Roseomonas chloroacetimidivorans TaxID=1766656 RepID=UPI003C774EB5